MRESDDRFQKEYFMSRSQSTAREEMQELIVDTKAPSIQDPSAFSYNGQIDSTNVARNGGKNGGYCQAESVVDSAKKLEEGMKTLGRRIKHHEENIKFLKAKINSLDESIQDLQVMLGNYNLAKAPAMEGEEVSVWSERETVEKILKHEESAASILCQLKTCHDRQAISLTNDVLGIVALLGKVNDENLSRLLSGYLGLEIMLAIVCRTSNGMKALETYNKDGSVNKNSGLHGLGASIGKPLVGRFVVFNLEGMSPYVGKFVANDPQKRLDLLKPKLPNGECPSGFLGFAVNMIYIDSLNLSCLTTRGHGLRETLLYRLFSHLQVYRTKAEMLQALPLISHGAISMDGGMTRDGFFCTGSREGVDVRFAIRSGRSYFPEYYAEIEQQIEEMKWKKEFVLEDLRSQESCLMYVRDYFNVKKQEFLQFLAQNLPYPPQTPISGSSRENNDLWNF